MTQSVSMFPFEFTVAGEPLSLNNTNPRSRSNWRQRVLQSAQPRWQGRPPINQRVRVTIITFFNNDSPLIDVDNVPKRILDAIKGTVIIDDYLVTDLVSLKRNRDETLVFTSFPSTISNSFPGREPFVYVEFAAARPLEVV